MTGRILFSAVAFLTLATAMGAAAPGRGDLEISADAKGVTIKTSKFTGSAQGLKYDQAKGVVVLLGSETAPASIVHINKGRSSNVCASRITISLDTGMTTIEGPTKASPQRN